MDSEIFWYEQADFPLLGGLIFLPLLAMALAWTVKSARQAFSLGLSVTGLELALALDVMFHLGKQEEGLQWVEHVHLTSWLSYHLGVDGIGILFVTLTAFLSLLVMLYGEITHEKPAGIYVASVFAFEAVLMGAFLSVDLLEFWCVCALELIPACFILGRWGLDCEGRIKALRLYLKKMTLGLALLLAGILALGWHHREVSGVWSFSLPDLLQTPLSNLAQSVVFLFLFFGLAVRMALFPFHAWLPRVAQYGPLATLCVFLVGLKVGVYALLRFVLPLLPHAVHEWKGFVAKLAVVGIFYGAALALMQINLRRLLAFAAISHSGMLAIGIFSLNKEGLQGSLLLAINFGVALSGMLFVAGILYRSTRTTLLPRLGGMFDVLPLLGITFLLAALSNMAMPGTPGFDATHLMLEGAIESHDWGIALAEAAGSVAAAAFLLWAFQRVFLALRRESQLHPEPIRLSVSEIALAGAVCLVLLSVGLYMEPWLEIVDGSLSGLAHQVGQAVVPVL